MTRVRAMTDEDAARVIAEVSSDAFARRPNEICSLYGELGG